MSLCPDCLQNNVSSFLKIMGIEQKILICENDDCIYVEKCPLLNNAAKNNYCSTIKTSIKSELEHNSSELCLSSSESEIEDYSLAKRKKFEFQDYNMLTTKRHLKILLNDNFNDNDLFNWFSSPLMMKFHSNFCFFLIIHLNLFNFNENIKIKTLKELYYKTESLVNNIPKKFISLLAFNLLHRLYEEHHVFNLSNIDRLGMSERILKSLGNFISTLNNGDIYKTIYGYEGRCKDCKHIVEHMIEDFSVKLPRDYHFENNKFIFTVECKKCFGQREVVVTIERLAKFLIIDLPNGTNNDFKSMMSTAISTVTGDKTQLQSIVELQCPLPIKEFSEKIPNIDEFLFKSCIKQNIQFRIHFRNTDGWYCVDYKSRYLVRRLIGTDIKINLPDVRFLIYGHLNDTTEMKSSISEVSLYKELEEYKKPPCDFVNYPREEIKYWLFLLKYRDLLIKKSGVSQKELTEIAKEITFKLSDHMLKKNKRIMESLKNEKISKEKDDSDYSVQKCDSDTIDNNDNDKQLDCVNFKDFILPLKKPEKKFIEQKDKTTQNPDPTVHVSLPLCSLYNSKSLEIERGIDQLLESKRRKIAKKKHL